MAALHSPRTRAAAVALLSWALACSGGHGETDATGGPDGPRVVALAVGNYHSCAVSDQGALRCWGSNLFGQLGYGNGGIAGCFDPSEEYVPCVDAPCCVGDEPGDMPPPDVDVGGVVVAVGGGNQHTCALLEGGAVRCWGSGFIGQLGYGDDDDRGDDPGEMPPPDVDIGGVVTQLVVGWQHNCALLESGAVRCWGYNENGELGIETDDEAIGDDPGEMPPPDVNLGGAGVVELAVGARHTCALMDDGAVRCWGWNAYAQLGDGLGCDTPYACWSSGCCTGREPGSMPPPPSLVGDGEVISLALGQFRSCAVMASGETRCWGSNAHGELGIGARGPAQCVGFPEGPENLLIYCAADPACCVGDDEGELPPAPIELGGDTVAVALDWGRYGEGGHGCARGADGSVRCWGVGSEGQLGYGDLEHVGDGPGEMPPPALALDGPAAQLVTSLHNCALLEDGSVRCWGTNGDGELGYGHRDDIGDEPGEMPPAPVSVF